MWFNLSLNSFQLDIIGFLAILGEGCVSASYQVSTLSKFIYLPRLMPAPQAFMRPSRPLRLQSVPGTVVGLRSGNVCQYVYRLPHIILPGEDMMASENDYAVRRWRIRVKKFSEESQQQGTGQGQGRITTLVKSQTFGWLTFLALVGCAMSIALLVLSIVLNDGWAFVATILLSSLSSILGLASKWSPALTKRSADRKVPEANVVICYPNRSFLIVECDETIARALFFSPERCNYLVSETQYRCLSLLGTLVLMVGVVALGNAQIELQLAFGASYLILNAAYWVVAALPEKTHWDYEALDVREIGEVNHHENFTDALWTVIKETKRAKWARTGQIAPATKTWDKWLAKARRAAKLEEIKMTWNAGRSLTEFLNEDRDEDEDDDVDVDIEGGDDDADEVTLTESPRDEPTRSPTRDRTGPIGSNPF